MAKPIMIQGTMSNAGKSLLAAGLCRVLAQDGYRVVPFKSQNMALNSFVTRDGREMGRAQVMQAEAAGVEPDVAMNPILLKPEGDAGSQVIVEGVSRGTLSAREYFARKHELVGVVRHAYDRLAAQADVVVVEGAGSPAEINLAEGDFVNMGLARLLDAPVVLVGDIDPGGVFAQLYGTVALLPPEDRARVKGLVVNKFRGDPEILRPGLAPLEELAGAPVLGVVPYTRLDLDDEDSLSPRLRARAVDAPLDVAAVRLPRLSNFTDLAALDRHPLVGVRYVERADDLGRPDLVVLPGTKSTLSDARWLRDRGFFPVVRALAEGGTPVVGICGGYQLLGRELVDPTGADGGGSAEGVGLLPLRTAFGAEKRLARTSGCFAAVDAGSVFSVWEGLMAEGYEIHVGTTELLEGEGPCGPALFLQEGHGVGSTADAAAGRPEGAVCGNVLGTYLHGLFDAPGIVDALADELLRRRGLPPTGSRQLDPAAYRQQQYDLLAKVVRSSLDMEQVYRIIEEGA